MKGQAIQYAFALFALAAVTAAPLAAQTAASGSDSASAPPTPAAIAAAAASIRAADLARHHEVLTADSLPRRAPPSEGVETIARSIAEQFQAFSLRPRGDQTPQLDSAGSAVYVTVAASDGSSSQVTGIDTSFVQRYPLVGNMTANPYISQLTFFVMLRKQGKPIIDANQMWPTEAVRIDYLSFADKAFFAADSVPQSGGAGPWASSATPEVFVVAGPQTVQTVRAAQLQDKLVLYLPHAQADTATRRQILDQLRTSNRVVILSAEDSAAFAARRQAVAARPVLLVDRYLEAVLGVRYWAVEVRADVLKELLTIAGIDPAAARVAAAPTVRRIPDVTAMLNVPPGAPADSVSAPNVIGLIPGSDTAIRDEYVVYSAPMEHASGLLALANAFRQPGARPRRSVLFAALSGAAPEYAGASAFVMNSPVEVENITVNLALGPFGRHASDAVTIVGIHDLELASRPDWLASQHPELGLAVADGGTILTTDAAPLPFIRRAVPSLYVSSGDGADADTTSAVDFEHAARALRFAFYLGQDLANAPKRTTWTSAGRRDRVRLLGQ